MNNKFIIFHMFDDRCYHRGVIACYGCHAPDHFSVRLYRTNCYRL